MARIPRTRYPLNIEKSYAKNINQLVNELDSLVLYEFDKIVAPEIDKERLISDDLLNDSILDFIKNAIVKIKGL
ncbi:MAG: phage head morphogenesis protein, partial [Carnobacterium sp.]